MRRKPIESDCTGKVRAGDTMVFVYKSDYDKLKSDRNILRSALVGVCTTDDVELLTAMVKKYQTTDKRFKYSKEVIAALKALLEVRP